MSYPTYRTNFDKRLQHEFCPSCKQENYIPLNQMNTQYRTPYDLQFIKKYNAMALSGCSSGAPIWSRCNKAEFYGNHPKTHQTPYNHLSYYIGYN